MFPNDPQNHPGNVTSLPAMPPVAQPQQQMPLVSSTAPVHHAAAEDIDARVAAQAKQLTLQYAGDPYKLSEALSQLKSAYLAEQYHITANQVEN
jgi:hypothetical protein